MGGTGFASAVNRAEWDTALNSGESSYGESSYGESSYGESS